VRPTSDLSVLGRLFCILAVTSTEYANLATDRHRFVYIESDLIKDRYQYIRPQHALLSFCICPTLVTGRYIVLFSPTVIIHGWVLRVLHEYSRAVLHQCWLCIAVVLVGGVLTLCSVHRHRSALCCLLIHIVSDLNSSKDKLLVFTYWRVLFFCRMFLPLIHTWQLLKSCWFFISRLSSLSLWVCRDLRSVCRSVESVSVSLWVCRGVQSVSVSWCWVWVCHCECVMVLSLWVCHCECVMVLSLWVCRGVQ